MKALAALERFFEWLLQTTWQAAVIAALILLAQFLLRRRLSPAWRHGLWFLLLARLLLPMAPSSPVSVFNVIKWPRPQAPAAGLAPPLAITAEVPATALSSPPASADLPLTSAPPVQTETVPEATSPVWNSSAPTTALPSSPVNSINWMAVAASAWLAGVLAFSMRYGWLNYRFQRRLAGYVPVSDDAVRALFQECAESLGVKERPVAIETEEVESPAVYGLWRKRLLLPDGLSERLSPDELRHVLLHELAHLKRRDLELNCLLAILRTLHWFNPVLWFAFARMRADRELATDDVALAQSQPQDRQAYGETVIKVLDQLTEPRVLPALVGIAERKEELRQRIRAIARGRVDPRWRWAAGTAAVVIAGLALTNAREDSPTMRTKAALSVDLLKRYPTTLTAGDTSPERGRAWEFTEADLFRLSRFNLKIAKLQIETGPADLAIGHCSDGAVWAIVLPREGGRLRSTASSQEEAIGHVWLRSHPQEITRLFPAKTVFSDGDTNLLAQMRAIAGAKFRTSWQSSGKAVIPEPKDMTVFADTKDGIGRFFIVDTKVPKAQYSDGFERRSVKAPPPISAALAAEAFDVLWQAFDRDYAMFVLRPEVNWDQLRAQYRPKAVAAKSAYEFAGVCAEMLKPLRDLHISLKVAGAVVPVFNRPRVSNSNPAAHRTVIGELNGTGSVRWAVTAEKIGFLGIGAWNDSQITAQCDLALERMRDTRGLIVDVRLNGGGSEPLAAEVAGRFLKAPFVYGFNQYRAGPAHTNLTAKMARRVNPRGPWRYDRPVVLLMGQKCMSSNESFIAMMTGDPDLVTMGDRTCGSSGNPRAVYLPLAMSVRVPRWIDYLPDGSPLHERGLQPQVHFAGSTGDFVGNRDELLSAALERLRKLPLPEKPIQVSAVSSHRPQLASDRNR